MSNQIKLKGKEQSRKDCFLLFKNNIYLILGMGIAAAICMYGILGIFGFSAYPDEFGYWSPAAALCGYDWSEITGLGSYYSYGYSALLVPILFLFHDAIITYRAAIILNLILQCLAAVLLLMIIREIFPDENKSIAAIEAIIAILYPAWLFYVQTTMAEAVLYFGLVLSVFAMLRFMKKPGVITGLFLAIVLIYLYMVHMRCLGAIAAGLLTVLMRMAFKGNGREKKNGKALLILLLIVALFAGSFVLKDRIVQLLYHRTSDDVLSWNDYSGIMYRIKKIISLKGIEYLLKDICGKALYMGLSTFGIAYFGIVGCAKKAIAFLKNYKRKKASYIDFVWIYIFLTVIFQFLVALVYLNGASAPYADRLDNFLHGRYIDFFLPILFVVGIEEMLHSKKLLKGMLLTIIIMLAFSVVCYIVISTNDVQMRNAHDFTMIGMSYFIKTPMTDTPLYFKKQVLLLLIMTLLTGSIIALSRKTRHKLFVALILPMQVFFGVKACSQFIFLNQSYIFEDIYMADVLSDVKAAYPEKNILHIYEGDVPYVQLVQFGCRDAKISVVNAEEVDIDINEFLRDDTILIASECQDYEETLDDYFEEKWQLGHLRLYYTP